MRIVGVAGSLRQKSFNKSLLRAAVELAPAGMTIDAQTIEGIPLSNEDIEADAPDAVATLRAAIASADGLLFVSPEYNAGIPGVAKNAIDWLSRPPGKSVLKGKPVGLIGASTGVMGTVRAQIQLRSAFEHNWAIVMPQPQVFVGPARERFDAEGRLTDEKTRAFLAKYLDALAAWVQKQRAY